VTAQQLVTGRLRAKYGVGAFVFAERANGKGGWTALPTPRKEAIVAELTDGFQRSNLTIVADYRGLTVAAMQDFRKQLAAADSRVVVAKNTLAKIAAKTAEREEIAPALEGPTALVFSFGDPAAAAKVVTGFARTSRILTLRGALLESSTISVEQVNDLASLPPREELLGKVAGSMSSPLYGIVGVLAAPMRSMMYVLQARAQQLEAGGEPEAAAA
jgi:large subunit ribosomal protein L10